MLERVPRYIYEKIRRYTAKEDHKNQCAGLEIKADYKFKSI